eukprot:g674.t1
MSGSSSSSSSMHGSSSSNTHDEEKNSDVPHEFLCPITKEIFVDPVLASDNFTYERKVIKEWFKSKLDPTDRTIMPLSPMTGATMTSRRLQANQVMKTMIAQWKKANSTIVRQKKILDNLIKSCMMAETIEEVQSSLGKIMRMTDSIAKKECNYENENDSNQMLIIIYGQVEKLKKRLSRFPEFLNDDIEKMFQHILNSCSSAASSVKEEINKNNEELSSMKQEKAKLDVEESMVGQQIDEMEFRVNNNLIRFLLKKQYLLKLKGRQAKELKNADLLNKKNKELESLLPKSSNLFTPSKDGSGSNFSSNSAVSTNTTTTATTTTPATNKKKRKRSNEKDDGNKKEVLNVKEIMIESIDVESNYNFNYFLNDKDDPNTWWQTFHDSDQLRARFVHDHKNGRTTWVALESFVASHGTRYNNRHRAIFLPIAKAIFPNILIKQKPLPVSLLILVAEDYRRLLNPSTDRIDHGTNCDKTSFMWNRISADSEFHDDVKACAYVGFAYFNGKGVKRSSRNAWPYLKKAAKLGHYSALMICTSNGKEY